MRSRCSRDSWSAGWLSQQATSSRGFWNITVSSTSISTPTASSTLLSSSIFAKHSWGSSPFWKFFRVKPQPSANDPRVVVGGGTQMREDAAEQYLAYKLIDSN
jgi:hypothetical protein